MCITYSRVYGAHNTHVQYVERMRFQLHMYVSYLCVYIVELTLTTAQNRVHVAVLHSGAAYMLIWMYTSKSFN